jgi:hypothetical protein
LADDDEAEAEVSETEGKKIVLTLPAGLYKLVSDGAKEADMLRSEFIRSALRESLEPDECDECEACDPECTEHEADEDSG